MWTYPHLSPAQKPGTLGHSLSGPIDWSNSREEFEGDLLSIDLDPDVESAGKPHDERFESRSAKPSAFFTSALVHVAFFWALVFIPASQVADTSAMQATCCRQQFCLMRT